MITRGDWIRTSGLLLPKQARYQAALRPVPSHCGGRCRVVCRGADARPEVIRPTKVGPFTDAGHSIGGRPRIQRVGSDCLTPGGRLVGAGGAIDAGRSWGEDAVSWSIGLEGAPGSQRQMIPHPPAVGTVGVRASAGQFVRSGWACGSGGLLALLSGCDEPRFAGGSQFRHWCLVIREGPGSIHTVLRPGAAP